MLVHQAGDFLVLEGLTLHHVAPVAGRVADTEQDGFVFALRLFQRLLAPRVPVYRVVRVLQQVRARLIDEPVGMFVLFLSVYVVWHLYFFSWRMVLSLYVCSLALYHMRGLQIRISRRKSPPVSAARGPWPICLRLMPIWL